MAVVHKYKINIYEWCWPCISRDSRSYPYVTSINSLDATYVCCNGIKHHTAEWYEFYNKHNATVTLPDERFPHKCPKCGKAAYVGFLQVEHPKGVECR